jgi:two-component system OmpR family response regulator
MPQSISLIEDEPDQRSNCADALRAHGYCVSAYADRASALAGFEQSKPELTILDIILGDDVNGGFDLCRDLLARVPDHPIIFLTTRVDEISQVSGLTLGAWDYLSKPVSLRFLVEKVAILLRLAGKVSRSEPGETRRHIGDLTLDASRMRVDWRGQPLELTLTEFRILEALAMRPGHVATYEQLMESAKQGVVTRNTVNTHILHLRRKFRTLDSDFAQIDNEYALGYRWRDE